MKKAVALTLLLASTAALVADIHIPPRPGPTRKLGSGIAKVAFSGAYILDSLYDKIQNESGTSAFTFGIVEGTAKTIFSTGLGIAEVATFYAPPYDPFNSRYDMPPADLKDNFW